MTLINTVNGTLHTGTHRWKVTNFLVCRLFYSNHRT